MSDFWNGSFSKGTKGFVNRFDVVGIKENPAVGIVEVRVTFYASPGKEYVFEIDEDDFQPDKQHIAEEILRQLQT